MRVADRDRERVGGIVRVECRTRQEHGRANGLAGMLAESRASYDTLRTEFYQVERKATAPR